MTWINVHEAKTILGYRDAGSVSKLAIKHNVRKKKKPKGLGYLYHKNDIIAAISGSNHHEKYRNDSFWNDDWLVKYNNHFRLTGDWNVIADTHCPFVDWDFWEQSLKIRDKNKGPNQLLLAGDTLNCSAMSRFYSLVNVPWEKEKISARIFLRKALAEYDKVAMLTGNHEMRYLLKMWIPQGVEINDDAKNSDLWAAALRTLLEDPKLAISIYGHCDINGRWHVTHPKTARKIPLSLARELNAQYNKSIIVTHAHMTGFSFAPNGKDQLCDCGCFFNPYLADYKNLVDTAHFQWSESFISIQDNFGQVYVKGQDRPVVVKV